MRNFRGLTKEGTMVYGWHFEDGRIHYILKAKLMMGGSLILNRIIDGMYEVIPETVGQQIGIKDRDKDEMYVGDVYKWYRPFVKDGVQLSVKQTAVVIDNIPELFYLSNRAKNNWGGVKIIGNIHQNPKLLETK